MFLATLLVAIYRRPVWLAPVYLAIAALLAVAANVLRVSVVAMGDVWLSIDLAEGWQHELVGYTALCLSALLLLSFDHLLTALLHPVDPVVDGEHNVLITAWNFMVGDEHHDDAVGNRQHSAILELGSTWGSKLWKSIWTRRILAGVLSLLGVVGIAQAVNLQRPVPIFISPTEAIFHPREDVLDREFPSLAVREHERARGGANPRLGENADIWTCVPRQTQAEIQVVLSQPYAGWHELCICYEINAWILLNREIRPNRESDSDDDTTRTIPYALARFKNADGRYAYLIYSAIDADVNIVEPPPRPGRLGNRFMEYFGDAQQTTSSNLMMMQMFVVATEKLESHSVRELAADFVEMRSIIQEGIKRRNAGDEDVDATTSQLTTIPADQKT
jgi:exosortase/archaeosortase family protein